MTREEINKDKQNELDEENTRNTIKKIIKIFIKVTCILILFVLVFFSYNTYISTVKVKVREYRLINKKIPDSFNGIKIIQFSDLHYGRTMLMENVKSIKKMINMRKPDIIVFTGDLIDSKYKISDKEKEQLIKELSSLKATLGKYAVFGNEDDDELLSLYNQAGFIILNNDYDLVFNSDNNPILLIGLGSLIKDKQSIDDGFKYFKEENNNKDIYTIVMVHEPDSIIDISSLYEPDLVIAGHSHNGNVIVPFINYGIDKENGAKKYNGEYYSLGKTKLYISSGLGTNNKTGIRLFCRPSINFFRISNS